MARIKFWPDKGARRVIVEIDGNAVHVEVDFDLDDADAAHVDLADAIRIVKEDWS